MGSRDLQTSELIISMATTASVDDPRTFTTADLPEKMECERPLVVKILSKRSDILNSCNEIHQVILADKVLMCYLYYTVTNIICI